MWVNISVDVSDMYEELSDRDKYTLLEWLEDDGITLDSDSDGDNEKSTSMMKEDWNETCIKLSNLYYQMSNEEQELINKIIKKYI